MPKRRIFAALLAVVMAGMMLCTGVAAADEDDYKEELDALSSKYDELETKQKELVAQINKTKTEKDKYVLQKKELDNQIYGVRQQIGVLNDKITLLEGHIAQKEDELQAQTGEIEENYEMLKKRLRVMYKAGNASVLGLVLGAEDFSEFLTRTQVASRVAKHDQELIEEMQGKLAEIKKTKESIEADKSSLESSRTQQSSKQNELAGQIAVAQDQIQDISALESDYLANKSALDKQMKEVQSEVNAIYSKIKSEGEYEGGIMLWPVEGYQTVTSDFGWRFGGTDYHTGIDIARLNAKGQGIYGKPIRAVSDGTVVFTQNTFITGRGYGRYLIVDHGGGISSLYGHTSALNVTLGQKVKRGQTIAYVGSTGWSTGPHLHFEVRVNGVYTNPWPYLR